LSNHDDHDLGDRHEDWEVIAAINREVAREYIFGPLELAARDAEDDSGVER
jgi:hypothetical protein